MADIVPIRHSELSLLHPQAIGVFTRLLTTLEEDYVKGKVEVLFKCFETYRTPQRQLYFYKKQTSKALPFRSAHQFGLAADIVPYLQGHGFMWDVDTKNWDWLRSRAHAAGLINDLSWDRAHVEHPLWRQMRQSLHGA